MTFASSTSLDFSSETASALTGPLTTSAISRTRVWKSMFPSLETSVGLVVTPATTPQEQASLISSRLAVSRKNFHFLSPFRIVCIFFNAARPRHVFRRRARGLRLRARVCPFPRLPRLSVKLRTTRRSTMTVRTITPCRSGLLIVPIMSAAMRNWRPSMSVSSSDRRRCSHSFFCGAAGAIARDAVRGRWPRLLRRV